MKKENLVDLIYKSPFPAKVEMPLMMGIVNLTDDSFFDGSQYNQLDKALKQVEKLLLEGADIIDLGAESSRPGARVIPENQEVAKLIPVLTAVKKRFDCFVSIDTYKPKVMKIALDSGADMINDIYALAQKGALTLIAEYQVPVCLMHMQNNPKTMQKNPLYQNVVHEVIEFLSQRVQTAINAGIEQKNLIIDVGFGFGKTFNHNLELLNHLNEFTKLKIPLLVGISQKSMLKEMIKDKNGGESRLIASIICAAFAQQKGARILRVHNVKETKQAITTWQHLLH